MLEWLKNLLYRLNGQPEGPEGNPPQPGPNPTAVPQASEKSLVEEPEQRNLNRLLKILVPVPGRGGNVRQGGFEDAQQKILKLGKRAVPALLEALRKTRCFMHKGDIVETVGKLGAEGAEAIPVLAELAEGKCGYVPARETAAYLPGQAQSALYDIGTPEALAVLEALKNRNR